MTDISKKLLADLRAGRTKGLLSYVTDPRAMKRGRSAFYHHARTDIPEEVLEEIHRTFDLIMQVNQKMRAAIRGLEVLARYTELDYADLQPYRKKLNEVCRDVVRLLPDSLCEQCFADTKKRRTCRGCGGKGYLSLADLGLQALP